MIRLINALRRGATNDQWRELYGEGLLTNERNKRDILGREKETNNRCWGLSGKGVTNNRCIWLLVNIRGTNVCYNGLLVRWCLTNAWCSLLPSRCGVTKAHRSGLPGRREVTEVRYNGLSRIGLAKNTRCRRLLVRVRVTNVRCSLLPGRGRVINACVASCRERKID